MLRLSRRYWQKFERGLRETAPRAETNEERRPFPSSALARAPDRFESRCKFLRNGSNLFRTGMNRMRRFLHRRTGSGASNGPDVEIGWTRSPESEPAKESTTPTPTVVSLRALRPTRRDRAAAEATTQEAATAHSQGGLEPPDKR